MKNAQRLRKGPLEPLLTVTLYAHILGVLRKAITEILVINYESRYDDKSRYYDGLYDDASMQDSIKKSRYYDKSRYKDRFSADRALS